MRLSPLDIYNKEFSKSTFGYQVRQVDEFLEEVGMAYERLFKELNLLQDENEKLKDRLENYENMEERLEKMLTTIQMTAKEQARQAHKEAELIIQKAEIKAEQLEKEIKTKMNKEYKSLEELQQNKELFKIRFRTLLESHLQLLAEDDNIIASDIKEDIAAGKFELDE